VHYNREQLVEYQMKLSFQLRLIGNINCENVNDYKKNIIIVKNVICRFWSFEEPYNGGIPLIYNIDPEYNIYPYGKLIDDVFKCTFIAGRSMFSKEYNKNKYLKTIFIEKILNDYLETQVLNVSKSKTLIIKEKFITSKEYGYFFSEDIIKNFTFSISKPEIIGKIVRTNNNETMNRVVF